MYIPQQCTCQLKQQLQRAVEEQGETISQQGKEIQYLKDLTLTPTLTLTLTLNLTLT